MTAYHSQDLLAAMDAQADAALARTAERMAYQTLRNMLHLDPHAAVPYGGRTALYDKLIASTTESLTRSG